jgi:DNA-directed RNA polymerase specialized sigma24 family protein
LVRKLKTKFGAHTEKRLKDDPYNHYVKKAFEAIAAGDWEWKDRPLAQQLIRIMNSHVSTEVEKYRNSKEKEKTEAPPIFVDIESFYNIASDDVELSKEEVEKYQSQVKLIEEAIQDDDVLVDIWLLKLEGKSRSEIATELDKSPEQIDKQVEKLKRKVKKHLKQQSNV